MENRGTKIAIIIGAGPAGLTAAYELVKHTDIKPIIIEMSNDIGGISKTVNYKGNRIDIGGHRFFSKSDRIMDWWENILPIQRDCNNGSTIVSYQNKSRAIRILSEKPNSLVEDNVMLVRNRVSRIYFLRKFFDYPISLSFETISNIGIVKSISVLFSYLKAVLFPIRQEKTLEDFLINRFGKTLYLIFFKDYTEKVWGVSCNMISAEWGKQRIKGLSIMKAIMHFVMSKFRRLNDLHQKNVETSLLEKFLYPKYGPGQMWEEVARIVEFSGGRIYKNKRVVKLQLQSESRVQELVFEDIVTKSQTRVSGDYFFSTMPVKDLIESLGNCVSRDVRSIANGLVYRDFITVGLLLNRLKVQDARNRNLIQDNWIYIQEPDVKIGRLQIFNNWSPYMVKNPNTVWLGLEYFCNEGEELWRMSDVELTAFAISELCEIDIIENKDVLDHTVIRMPKAYPAYFGTYSEFSKIREFTDKIENLFLIGRNGMHKYNNQDHSMLTAIKAVENIINNVVEKDNLWAVNLEDEYHEEK